MKTLRYGDEPSLFVELHGGDTIRGTAIVVHGGWWRTQRDLHMVDPIAVALATDGWLVANIEYRRIDGDTGGWPATLEDVLTAISFVAPDAELPTVVIGHSAGGHQTHLALLAAKAAGLGGVVALAPVTDVARSDAEGLGEGALTLFLPTPDPAASPIQRLPLGCPQLVVHGDADLRVPVEHSRDYVAAARRAGDRVDYAELSGVDHFRLIDPADESWRPVRDWLHQMFA